MGKQENSNAYVAWTQEGGCSDCSDNGRSGKDANWSCDACQQTETCARHEYEPACGCEGAAVQLNRDSGSADETHVYFESCEGSKSIDVTTSCQNDENTGRILDVCMTLRNVCPGRRSALGVTVVEADEKGREYPRGFRTVSIPAHNAGCYRDVEVPAQRFILPEEMSLSGNGRRRHFIIRTVHHYLEESAGWGGR